MIFVIITAVITVFIKFYGPIFAFAWCFEKFDELARGEDAKPMWDGIRDLTPAQRKKAVADYEAYLNKCKSKS